MYKLFSVLTSSWGAKDRVVVFEETFDTDEKAEEWYNKYRKTAPTFMHQSFYIAEESRLQERIDKASNKNHREVFYRDTVKDTTSDLNGKIIAKRARSQGHKVSEDGNTITVVVPREELKCREETL